MGDNPVLFALDGTDKETYEYYRVKCVWEKTLENARAFIDAGGWAVWSMVQFSWNEHQLETAMDMAKDMGFLHFHTIYSNRNVERGVGTHEIGKKFFSKVEPLCLDRKRLFITARGNVFHVVGWHQSMKTFKQCQIYVTMTLSVNYYSLRSGKYTGVV